MKEAIVNNIPIIIKSVNYCLIAGFGAVETTKLYKESKKDTAINKKHSLLRIGSKYMILGLINGNLEKILSATTRLGGMPLVK